MDRQTFEEQFRARQWLLIDQVMEVVFEAQEDVFGLISELQVDDDRREATEMVERMAEVIPPLLEPRSRARRVAERVSHEALEGVRGREQKLAALAEARKRIWQLADEAGDEGSSIRGMSRGLEATERDLEYGGFPWSDELAEAYRPTVRERLDQKLWMTTRTTGSD